MVEDAVGFDMAADKRPDESSQREKAVIVGEFVVAASSRMGFSPLWMIRLISTYYSCLYSLKWHFFDKTSISIFIYPCFGTCADRA